jgi:hypothetical protein
MLLPTFMANPNMYAVTHPSVLTQLHPFADLRSLALSDSEWASRAKTLCF